MTELYFVLTTNLEECKSTLEEESRFYAIRRRQPSSALLLDAVIGKPQTDWPKIQFAFYDRVPTSVDSYRCLTDSYELADIHPVPEREGDYYLELNRSNSFDRPVAFYPQTPLWEALEATAGRHLLDFFAGPRVLIPLLEDDWQLILDFQPDDMDDALQPSAIQQSVFVAEKELQAYLREHLEDIEAGLKPFDPNHVVEYPTGDHGRIDILATDTAGDLVVIELKKGEPGDEVVGQLCRYMGWAKSELAGNRGVRGIIVASVLSQRVKYAVMAVPNVSLISYEVKFSFKANEASNS